ncbi:MAG: ATP-binding protein [Treponema sp.]|jgi:predicted AAA+ superfamily ATPase|nr:ATP-binding protein [Treponema sp.]
MYKPRHAEKTIARLARNFGALLVTGARQVGKTTLLKEFGKGLRYVTLDNPLTLNEALSEGSVFFKQHKPPLIIDEIQYAPGLFPYIKMIVDTEKTGGLFFMSGSQQFRMMKNGSESLAGRIGIVTLPAFSLREIQGLGYDSPFLPADDYFSQREKTAVPLSYDDLWTRIQRGTMPALNAEEPAGEDDWNDFYTTYTKTYIERDVRDLAQVGNERQFMQFLTIAAGRTGQLLNLSAIAQDTGISASTAERWLSILIASHIVYLLRPFSVNISKRMVKTPKLYFLDTALACFLLGWDNPIPLSRGPMAGALFETFVIGEVIKSYDNAGREAPVFFYRDRDGKEIDLLIVRNGVIHPLEIKKHANPGPADIAVFGVTERINGYSRGSGGVICACEEPAVLKGDDRAIPVSYL